MRERSNMNSIAAASLHTSGSICNIHTAHTHTPHTKTIAYSAEFRVTIRHETESHASMHVKSKSLICRCAALTLVFSKTTEQKHKERRMKLKHPYIYKLALPSKVPDREGDMSVAYADSFLHEIDSESLDIIFVKGTL